MAESRTFRSALNGFNREDVVRYIESLNTKHTTLVNQLNSELQSLTNELEGLRAQLAEPAVSDEEHTAVVQERDALRAELEALKAEQANQTRQNITEAELAAYRRAEQTERAARDWAQQMYRQAIATLADATAKVDASAVLVDTISRRVAEQQSELQAAVAGSRATLQEAASAIAAICPEGE